MEGFLFEKRGEDASTSLFGSGKVYKKRWVELQGHLIQVKDDFASSVKTKINVLDCIVKKTDEDPTLNMHYVLEIAPNPESKNPYKNTKSYRFAAMDDEILEKWIRALNIEVDRRNERNITVPSMCSVLKLPAPTQAEPVTKTQATKAYRKLMLSVHPDKGGDEEEFMRVQRAYDGILKHLEREKTENQIVYDVTIMKTADGIGLHVEEDEATGEIVIRGMGETCKILEITKQAGGTFHEGDVLQRIDDQNVSEWRFSRIRARLSDERYPVGSKITFQFTRYASTDADNVPALESAEGEASNTTNMMNSDGELVFNEGAAGAGTGDGDGGGGGDYDGDRTPSVDLDTIESVEFDDLKMNGTITKQQEQLRLQHKLVETEELLAAERAEREDMEHDLLSLQEQVSSLAAQLAISKNSESYLMEQLRELIVHGVETSESDATVNLQRIVSSGEDVKRGKPVPLSEATANYVKSPEFENTLAGGIGAGASAQAQEKLSTSSKFPFGVMAMTDNGGKHDLHISTRLALAATSAVDPHARVIKRWSVGGTSALERLMKMEKRLQNIEGERAGYTLPGSGPVKDDAVDEDKESVRSRESNAGAGVGAGLHRRPTAPVPLTGARKSLAEHAGSKGQALFSSLHAAKKVTEPDFQDKARDRLSFRDEHPKAGSGGSGGKSMQHMAGGRRKPTHRESAPLEHHDMNF